MKASQYLRISRTPEILFNSIPKQHKENLDFRKDLHTYLWSDQPAKTDFLAKAFFDPRIFFDACLWTYDPRADHGYRHIPFLLWPHQEIAVLRVKNAIEARHDLLFDKSRAQGATYIILGTFLLYWLVSGGSRFLLGSRKEELVDSGCEIIDGMDGEKKVVGSEESLFYKLLYMLSTLPLYLQPRSFKKNLFLQNLELDSGFKGEATNIGFGKGFRGSGVLVDEAAQIEPKIAGWITENLADTGFCNIFNSTVGPWGESHPYSKSLKKYKDNVIVLDWLDNPNQNQGKYRSPKEGYVEIADVDYYRKHYPGEFNDVEPNTLVEITEGRFTYPFAADGGVSNWGCWRTVWYDQEEKRPSRTKRGLAQNILRMNTGAVDAFFDYELVVKLSERTRNPDFCGDVESVKDEFGNLVKTMLNLGGKDSPLYFWGKLDNRRPIQMHTYTVGCDIARGTGSSNSVAAIYDCNLNEICGLYVNPYIKISDFAEKAVSICNWVGGQLPPLLNWEINGASEFYDRLVELGYYNLFVEKEQNLRKTHLARKYGWHNSGGGINGTKRIILNELSSALNEGFNKHSKYTSCKVYDEQSINEIEAYVNYEGKIDVGPVSLQTETSGAKSAHGDRVIAIALAVMASKLQGKVNEDSVVVIPHGSFMERMERVEREEAKKKKEAKQWYY